MDHCRTCLDERQDSCPSDFVKDDLREVIETIFSSKMKIEKAANFRICSKCEKILREFYKFYHRALENQLKYENLLKGRTEIKIKSERDEDDGSVSPVPSPSLQEPMEESEPKDHKRNKKSQEVDQEEENRLLREVFDLSCKECGHKKFLTLGKLRAHMRKVHDVSKLSLQCCSRFFLQKRDMVDHALTHINPEKLRCPLCSKQTTNRDNYRHHLQQHKNADKFPCESCGKRFNTPWSLKTHMEVHLSTEEKQKMKTHICATCGSAHASESKLSHHIRVTHERIYACICDVCAKSFPTKTIFLHHYKNVHGSAEANRVQCQLCKKWSANELNLRKHIRYSHAPGPHFCSWCNKEKATRAALYSHERYFHRSTRKYGCQFCDKAFKRPEALKEHLTTHLGGTLYNCDYCEKSCNSKASMYAHRKKIHPVEWERDRKK